VIELKISPLAARIAGAAGFDLSQIKGTGSQGKIIRVDLPGHDAPPAPARVTSDDFTRPPTTDIPHDRSKLSSMRRTIARRLTQSKQQIPHIYLTVDVELDPLLALRAEINAELAARGLKISVNDMIIRAQALALMACPEVNVRFDGDDLIRFHRADIAVAVSIAGGLITPVITAADIKSLSAISAEMKDLAARARDGTLRPEDYQGGTASLSNLGMFGIKQFEAVINPPQAMILAVGQGEQRVIPRDGQTRIATMMSITGSFDHRAVDGADAARMMGALRSIIEQPLQLLS